MVNRVAHRVNDVWRSRCHETRRSGTATSPSAQRMAFDGPHDRDPGARQMALSWLRGSQEAAMPTGTPLDTIDDALCRTGRRRTLGGQSLHRQRPVASHSSSNAHRTPSRKPIRQQTPRFGYSTGARIPGSPLIAISIDADPRCAGAKRQD
jgi:hypothetical protein